MLLLLQIPLNHNSLAISVHPADDTLSSNELVPKWRDANLSADSTDSNND
jgi:hypothetical protein